MRYVVADSSVWIDYLRRAETRETLLLREWIDPGDETDILLVPDLVLFEVLQGATTKAVRDRIDELMRGFGVVTLGGEDAALAAAERYRVLRAQGVTVRRSIDVLIASWCVDNNAKLLHRDRDFVPFVEAFGLQVA